MDGLKSEHTDGGSPSRSVGTEASGVQAPRSKPVRRHGRCSGVLDMRKGTRFLEIVVPFCLGKSVDDRLSLFTPG